MSTDPPPRDEKELRHRTIVDAAETVLAEKDRDAMTMADIADEARLSRSLLYVYFDDMDDILLGVTLRGLRSMRERFEAAVRENDTGLAQIRAIGEAYVRFSQEEPTYFWLVAQFESRTADSEEAPERMRQCIAEADRGMEVMTRAIRHGIEDGSIRQDLDPTQTAVTLWGCTHGLIQLAANKGNDLEERYDLDSGSFVAGGLDLLGLALTDEADGSKETEENSGTDP